MEMQAAGKRDGDSPTRQDEPYRRREEAQPLRRRELDIPRRGTDSTSPAPAADAKPRPTSQTTGQPGGAYMTPAQKRRLMEEEQQQQQSQAPPSTPRENGHQSTNGSRGGGW